jgi:hypothetical protein
MQLTHVFSKRFQYPLAQHACAVLSKAYVTDAIMHCAQSGSGNTARLTALAATLMPQQMMSMETAYLCAVPP